jgi:hypothetical protein
VSGWWWWVTLPRALGRRFLTLSVLAADGHVLVGLGPLAGLLPPAALAGGLWVGATHPGFDITFTESLTLMVVALTLGTISTQLGGLAVLGFAVGDFFIQNTDWATDPGISSGIKGALANPVLTNLVIVRGPLLIQYALLFALVIGVPVGARGLSASIAGRLQLPEGVGFVVTTVLVAVTSFVIGRFWAAAAPLVIRPVFTWTVDQGFNGGLVPIGAIQPLQDTADSIARAAALAVLGRAALTWLLTQARGRVIEEAEVAIVAPIERQRTQPGPFRAILTAAVVAGFAVLLLAGMIDDLWAAGVLALAFFVARLARSGLIPLPTRRWRATLARVPVLLRYGLVLLVMNGVAKAVIASSLNSNNRLQFLIWPVAGAALLMAFLMPEPPRQRSDADGEPAVEPVG